MNGLLGFAIVAIFAGAGAFLGSYLKRKGENLATQEDIDKLVEQVSAVTTATKQIETEISNDAWDRQKRWELKREVLFETVRTTALVKDTLARLYSVYQTEADDNPEQLKKRVKAFTEWNDAANTFEQATLLASLACGKELKKLLFGLSLFTRGLSEKIIHGQPEAFMASTKELAARLEAITAAMRKEIGVEESD